MWLKHTALTHSCWVCSSHCCHHHKPKTCRPQVQHHRAIHTCHCTTLFVIQSEYTYRAPSVDCQIQSWFDLVRPPPLPSCDATVPRGPRTNHDKNMGRNNYFWAYTTTTVYSYREIRPAVRYTVKYCHNLSTTHSLTVYNTGDRPREGETKSKRERWCISLSHRSLSVYCIVSSQNRSRTAQGLWGTHHPICQ